MCLPVLLKAQSLSIDIVEGSSNNLNTFSIENGSVEIGSNAIVFNNSGKEFSDLFSYGISADLSLMGILPIGDDKNTVGILSDGGDILSEYKVPDFSLDDPSLQIYTLNNGAVLMRDNIVSFSRFDPFGKTGITISGKAKSSDSQVIPQVAISPKGNTTIIYTRQIKNGGFIGSNVGRLVAGGGLKAIYSSQERIIKDLQISDDGQFVTIVTAKEGTDDEVLILDKYGNQINQIESSQDLTSTSLSKSAEFITISSESRAAVYDTISGERLGSTSFGAFLLQAKYFPEDEILLALSGNMSSNGSSASNIEFHAIHLGKREVERQEFGSSLGFNASLGFYFERISSSRYQLKGANKVIEVSAQF